MVQQLSSEPSATLIYPESDGKLMADNTKQFRWIVVIKENLELLFATDDHVFIAGDLLWYPVEGNNTLAQAPDTMVVFGRPKGDRNSYQQWREDNIAPQVVFEILSPSNRLKEMAKKLQFYERYGVEEYYLFDPDKLDLQGWVRAEDRLNVIEEINDWVSPQLGIKFVLTSDNLEIHRPDGERFLTFVELGKLREQEKQKIQQLEQAQKDAIPRLHELGLTREQIANVLSLSVEEVNKVLP
ncbi:Uma2 family endonuclease [Crocosphaera sp. XPORK-15E]|uniref:Uma2 family endonuclease n=1 Tax=Crocosphaera sp. XPORK-15E TaxID=3110247 RepID=UPI002B1E95F4|nr:Uma2 family endonuclease [Crocosphaera sp. XPORK-15E]MEA5532776.1 Uma2 family endonuclease [Crocosphaera sp. XPORK-15E]